MKQRKMFVICHERGETTEREMKNIIEEYENIKSLKVQNNIHRYNRKVLG